ILLGERQYGDAARELEAAAVLMTPTSSMQEKIAGAYFGARDNAKGVAALKKMAELDPQPPAWNHVASLLAKYNVGLDEAQQFAQRAVKTEEERAAQTSLEKLEADDVRCITNLADYWDTLGYVYFRQGKVAQAEK